MTTTTPKISPRDALANLGRDFDRLASAYKQAAADHALEALDGNEDEAREAKKNHGMSAAYQHAMQMVDAVRHRIEMGEVG